MTFPRRLLLLSACVILLAACAAPGTSPSIVSASQPPSQGFTPSTPTHNPFAPVTLVPAGPAQPTPVPAATLAVPSLHPSPTLTLLPTVTDTPGASMTFAAIGDFGLAGGGEQSVANLVNSWNPDIIITLGDNNYPTGSASSIDNNIGQYFHQYIYPYSGRYGAGAATNRFFPSLGNHDWLTKQASPYLNYFSLPGNERYYDFVWGPVHFFVLDSDEHEPDKVGLSSSQAAWLKEGLAASDSPWKIVYFHHAPFSSGLHGGTSWMRWPFQEWGASAVLSGHDHTYERIVLDGMPYFVNGLGGDSRYKFKAAVAGSQVRYNAAYGAMRVEASPKSITFQFINVNGETIDTYSLLKP